MVIWNFVSHGHLGHSITKFGFFLCQIEIQESTYELFSILESLVTSKFRKNIVVHALELVQVGLQHIVGWILPELAISELLPWRF